LADLLVQFVFLGIGSLVQLLATVAEGAGQASRRLLF